MGLLLMIAITDMCAQWLGVQQKEGVFFVATSYSFHPHPHPFLFLRNISRSATQTNTQPNKLADWLVVGDGVYDA